MDPIRFARALTPFMYSGELGFWKCAPLHSKHPAHATANVKTMIDDDNILTFVLCVNAAIIVISNEHNVSIKS